MAKFTGSSLNELLAGDEIRQVIRSQSPEMQRKIIFKLKNLLADFSPDTKPVSALDKYFSEHPKPLHLVRSKTGCAPVGTRWICILCPNQKQIKTRTNDLRRHLEKDHLCEKSEIDRVFNPKNPNRLWEYFGPCTEVQASGNGWDVGSYDTRKKKKTKLANTAFAGVKAPILKGVQNVKAIGKRKKSATSDSDFDSGLESSMQMMESLKLTSMPQAVATNTDFDGPTIVPQQITSSGAETFPSSQHEVFYSPMLYPADPSTELMAQDPSADLLGFSGQFQGNHNSMDSETIQTADLNSLEFGDLIDDNYFTQNYSANTPMPIPNPTMVDQAEISMTPSIPTAPIQIDNDFHTWDVIEFEKGTFPTLFNQEIQ